jgi:hypothetical protein
LGGRVQEEKFDICVLVSQVVEAGVGLGERTYCHRLSSTKRSCCKTDRCV